jgi:formate dehydrogenase maturation protein FdhE
MKINKTFFRSKDLELQRLIANEGCHICPCCENAPIDSLLIKSTCKIIWFKFIHIRKDLYFCNKCGAQWESDWYEFE